LSPNDEDSLVLPARSRQLPVTAVPPLSGPPYVTAEQESIPDIASLPLKLTATGWLYQPFLSAPRSGLALVT
jgi:hypothetical protein